MDDPRLIAVGTKSNEYDGVENLGDLSAAFVDEIEHFFVSYNAAWGNVFAPMGRQGPKGARSILTAGAASHAKRMRSSPVSPLRSLAGLPRRSAERQSSRSAGSSRSGA